MKRIIEYTGLVLCLVSVVDAQDRAGGDNDREERLTMYLRTGRYADARRLIDEMLKTERRADLKNVRAVFANAPNMRVRRASATFTCEVSDTGVLLPITVEGKRVHWLVDTGANVTMVSEAEATRLGLVIRDSDGRAADHAGGSAGVRTAIARRVVIGRTQPARRSVSRHAGGSDALEGTAAGETGHTRSTTCNRARCLAMDKDRHVLHRISGGNPLLYL